MTRLYSVIRKRLIIFIFKINCRSSSRLKSKPVNDVREIVGSYIEQRVDHGFIRNRKDVLDAVSELGEVTRISDKFISLKLDGA
jgi:hypothetical protein